MTFVVDVKTKVSEWEVLFANHENSSARNSFMNIGMKYNQILIDVSIHKNIVFKKMHFKK